MAIVDKYISHITPLGSPDTYKLKAYLLKNGRTFKVKLDSANASTAFDGSANITDIGVSGILGTINGGTGNDSFTEDTLIYANTATKLASYTSTKGGTKKLWYLNAGIPTDSAETVGATDKPVFLSSGTITESTSTIGSGIMPIYMASGQIKASTSTIGTFEKPVYLNAGTITALDPVWLLSGGTATANNEDLNAAKYKAIGNYYSYGDSKSRTILNSPFGAAASTNCLSFTLKTEASLGTGTTYLRQLWRGYNSGVEAERTSTNSGSSWSTWRTKVFKNSDATTTQGNGEQPIYIAADGQAVNTTYHLKAHVEDGSINQLAYYSTARTIDYTPKIYYINSLASTAEAPINMQGLRIVGSAVGNDSSNKKTTISGTTGLLSYGDGGPQIQFSTSEKLDDRTTSGAQSGALIFTDHDAAATGTSWHFVSNQGDWNVISKRFHARTGISIGTSLPNTSYTLYTRGIANFNIAADNEYGIGGHRLNAIFEGTDNASILIASPTNNHAYGIAVNQNGNMYIGYRNNGSYTSYTGDKYLLILNSTQLYPNTDLETNLGLSNRRWKNIYGGNFTYNGTIYFGDGLSDSKPILAYSTTYPYYGIYYWNESTDVIAIDGHGKSNSKTEADLAINALGAGVISTRNRYIPHTGNNTGTVGTETRPVYVNAGTITPIDTSQANYTYTFTVTGDKDTWYPVVFSNTANKSKIHIISIWKDLGSTTAAYSSGNHSNGTSSMWLIYEHRYNGWDGNGGYCKTWYYFMPYADLVAKAQLLDYGVGKICVWLRGGTTEYKVSADYNITATPYYSATNVGSSTYPVNIAPVTTITDHGWNITNTVLGYGDIYGNATTATMPLGFTSRNTNATWGNQVGATVTSWNGPGGCSVDWRQNNPQTGQLSMKVDGTVYINEGQYPVLAQKNANGYPGFLITANTTNHSTSAYGSGWNDTGWLRTTSNGFIPYEAGGAGSGHSSLGTSSWYFKTAYIDTIHGNLSGNAATATKLSNTPNNTTTFLRGDNTWSNTLTGTLILSRTTDASGTADNKPALIVGGLSTAAHIEIDSNEILAKSNGTTPTTLYLQDTTGTVSVSGSGGLIVSSGDLTMSSTDSYIHFNDSGTTTRGIQFKMGTNDLGRLVAGATAANAGWLELATADDGNEPIYIRQYTGTFTTITRTLTLLDANGDTTIPGKLFIQQPDTGRDNGIIGTYNYQKAAAIWSMGSAYQIAADGSGLGTLYGAAYGYQNQAYLGNHLYASGHQFLWCANGTINVALGTNLWARNTIMASSDPASVVAIGTNNIGSFIYNNGIMKLNSAKESWTYLRLHNGNNLWDIATRSNDNSGALQFRPGGNEKVLITTAGEIITPNPNAFRASYGNYGVIQRNDGNNYYFMLTDSGAAKTGSWNSLRPLSFSLTTGRVNMANKATISANLGVNGSNDSYNLYVNGTSYLTNNLYINAVGSDHGIYSVGTKATHRMIRFIDMTADTYGNGIVIGGGGLTILGSGESGDTLYSNLGYTGGSEVTVIGSDGEIAFYPSNNSYDASAKLSMTASRFWAGVNGNTAREAQVGVQSGAGQLYMYSNASTTGNRGIYSPAHGSGAAQYIFKIDNNNIITHYGGLTMHRTISGTSHAVGLQTEFNNNKATVPRDQLISYYSSAHSNGSQAFGYFLHGNDSAPYGGFFVAHYNTPRYVGISGGTYTQWRLLKGADSGAIGGTSTPIYIDSNGIAQPCTAYGSATNIRAATVNINDDTTSKLFVLGATTTGYTSIYRESSVYMQNNVLRGAAWNDYAEFRQSKENKTIEPGRVVYENGDDTLSISTQRLMRGCNIVSDTYGFSIGESEEAQLPIAVSGRVLAYPYEDKEEFKNHIGWPVCSGPNGTVSIMTEEEEMKYPSRIIGTISAVPDYEIWHGGAEVIVNGRVWIKVR